MHLTSVTLTILEDEAQVFPPSPRTQHSEGQCKLPYLPQPELDILSHGERNSVTIPMPKSILALFTKFPNHRANYGGSIL